MKIYRFHKESNKNQLHYLIRNEDFRYNYQIQRLAGRGEQFHLKNMKGEIFARILFGGWRHKKALLYFNNYSIKVQKEKDEYRIDYYRKEKDLQVDGGRRDQNMLFVQEEKILCQRRRMPLDEMEEWIFYEEDIEEMLSILFSIFYLEKD